MRSQIYGIHVEPLGSPIRKQPEEKSDPMWEPTERTGYYRRINPTTGKVEISHEDHMPIGARIKGRPDASNSGAALMVSIEQRFAALDEELAADGDKYRRLVDHRGGCSCFISPPCSACSDPITKREAEELGFLD